MSNYFFDFKRIFLFVPEKLQDAGGGGHSGSLGVGRGRNMKIFFSFTESKRKEARFWD